MSVPRRVGRPSTSRQLIGSTSINPRPRRRRGAFAVDGLADEFDCLGNRLPNYVDCGDCINVCLFCSALFWKSETVERGLRYTKCCRSGTVVLPRPLSPPPVLLRLYSDRNFMDSIRAYNLMFSMTSFGGTVNKKINEGGGPYVFKVNGQICHWLGSLCPPPSTAPRFLQMYIHDTDNDVLNRMNSFREPVRAPLSPDVVRTLSLLLNAVNRLVCTFKTAHEIAMSSGVSDYSVRLYASSVDRRYDSPVPGTLGCIVSGDDDRSNEYDIVIRYKTGHPRRISKLHQSYMSLHYPLLFPFGEVGWCPSLNLVCADGSEGRSLTVNMFYGNQFHDRMGVVSLVLMAGRLLQQYLVDSYLCIEHCRLQYIRNNQSTFRKEFAAGIHDAISRGDTEGRSVGQRYLLPSSFVGGPRYMYHHYQDALAICRVHGKPQYFITFTCNVGWPEIERHLASHDLCGGNNRPDIVSRVFHIKVMEFIKFMKQDLTFGNVTAYLYTIEFQKRGLPHCHTLLWVSQQHRILAPSDIDNYITAELPNPSTHPALYAIVTKFMIHGPCGAFNPGSHCMRDGRCKYSFPRPFSSVTTFDSDGFVRYKRNTEDFYEHSSGLKIHNDFVVPYNARLSSRFAAHINVEYCGWNMMIKYLFKYISKGADRVSYSIQKNTDYASTSTHPPHSEPVDEIQKFVDGRYICPYEAAWRILQFPIHERHPAVQTLAVHLPNLQSCTFTETTSLTNMVRKPNFGVTTLIGWFNYNQNHNDGRDIAYIDYPMYFWWETKSKSWIRRVDMSRGTIGRLIYVPPSSGELFYLRLLLCHQKGCISFESLRTVNGVLYPTFLMACEALDLVGDDREWLTAFREASDWATAIQLRSLFCNLLMFCDVTDTMLLWEEGWRLMTDDISYTLSKTHSLNSIDVTDDLLQQQLLIEIRKTLQSGSPPRSLSEFNLPHLRSSTLSMFSNRLLFEESSYDRGVMADQCACMLSQLNSDQLSIFNKIKHDIANDKQSLLFVYGHGGTGKTFLWTTVLAFLRSEGKVVLAVAGSGIAALLLPGGRTAHSRFHIPLKITPESICTIKKKTQLSELLAATKLIIWDEATMTDRRCFECVDKSFRDILSKQHLPFGGISLLLGGDFRQTLPIKPKKSNAEILSSTIPNSYLWSYFKVCYLRKNMRVLSDTVDSFNFTKWLLSVGNGDVGQPLSEDSYDTKSISIPSRLLIEESKDPIQSLISFVYPSDVLEHPTPANLSNRAIVCPKNNTTEDINDRILSMTGGSSKLYYSVDSVRSRNNNSMDMDLMYPQDYLNQIIYNGLPPNKLALKINTPVILLRNINVREGLCNGTRLLVKKMFTHLIEADIITGSSIGTTVLIPKIKLIHDVDELPFVLVRKQFPIRVCYAMTINKSQGQSLQRVGVYLPHPVFGHGQLYVALSRATSVNGLKILILDESGHAIRKTNNVVFKELLSSVERNQID